MSIRIRNGLDINLPRNGFQSSHSFLSATLLWVNDRNSKLVLDGFLFVIDQLYGQSALL